MPGTTASRETAWPESLTPVAPSRPAIGLIHVASCGVSEVQILWGKALKLSLFFFLSHTF